MGWQIMGTDHLLKPAAPESEEDRIRRITREEIHKVLDEMAQDALQALQEFPA